VVPRPETRFVLPARSSSGPCSRSSGGRRPGGRPPPGYA
jgi:hypothetical protein